ncbi:MAG: c-type cytochrome [Synechococcales bacterium]|nr:c-type cytochrome [Synechococcales bacterium]
MVKRFWVGLVLGLYLLLGWPGGAIAADLDQGKQVFEQTCAGCHIKGGNIVRRRQTLKMKALQRNHRDSEAAIAEIVTHGKGIMSAYGDRLTPEEIQAVSAYVLQRAVEDWR